MTTWLPWRGDDVGEAVGDLAVVDDAGFGDVDAGDAGSVGFELADLLGGDAIADHAVGGAAFEQRFHSRQLGLVRWRR